MRVAQVCPRYWPHIGGVETRVKEISRKLVEIGFEVEVLTTDPSGKLPKESVVKNVKIKRFKSWAPEEAFYFSKDLRNYLLKNSNDFDIVHAHSYHAFPALYASQAKGKNMLVFTPHYHGTGHTLIRSFLHIPYRLLGKKIFEKTDVIVCVSDYEKDLIKKHFDVNKKNLVVIPNGVNLEDFKVLKKKKKNCRTILFVGRLEKYKGAQYLILALPNLRDDISLEIVGTGPYEKSLAELARKLCVENRVKFFRNLTRSELLEKYANADVFALLSAHEAFGICVAEALATKTPCILANTSGLNDWIDNENCFGVDFPIDVDKLVMLIAKVIGKEVNDVKLKDWNETVESLVGIYEDLINI